MRSLILFAVAVTFWLNVLSSSANAEASSAPDSADWRSQLVIAPDAAQQKQIYAIVVHRPQSDNGFLVSWLRSNISRLQPIFAFELSRRLFEEDRDAALEWFTVGRLRLVYDARRCTDPTAEDGLAFSFMINGLSGKVAAYVEQHGDEAINAFRRAEARADLFEYDASPEWICGHGMAAYGEALGIDKPSLQGPLKPPDQWPAIKQTLIAALPKAAEEMTQRLAEAKTAAAAAALRPHTVPPELASAARDVKLRAIGAEARASLQAARDASPGGVRPLQLLNLAEAQIDAGDATGARDTLMAVRPTKDEPALSMSDGGRLVLLLVRAGDSAAASSYTERVPNPSDRFWVLGEYGAALARSTDLAGAHATVQLVARTAAEPAPSARPAAIDVPPRDAAIRKIGAALVEVHDAKGALQAASLISQDDSRVALTADIAGRQCADGDDGARETLRRADEAAHALKDPQRSGAVDALAYAFAACGEVERAVAVARELQPERSAVRLDQLARRLMEHGDQDRARQVDAANADAFTEVNGMLTLAQREIARGEVEVAKANLAKASARMLEAVRSKRAAVRPVYEILDTLQPVGGIVAAQAQLGCYADAIRTTAGEDAINRPQFFVSVIAAAATQHDGSGVKEAQRMLFDAIWHDDPNIPANQLIQIVKLLGGAGYVDEAKQVLDLVPEPSRRSEIFAQAEAAIGDMDGARATLNALGWTDAQRKQGLVRIALAHHDLASAKGALAGSAPDDALSSVASAEAKDGDMVAAMATAWRIQGLENRANTLVGLLKAFKRS